MRFDGIGLVEKPKLIKILHAIELNELAGLYSALRGADEQLRIGFVKYLSLNNIKGGELALIKLKEIVDPLTAIRAASITLLAVRIAGKDN